jgi:hypothetical protein
MLRLPKIFNLRSDPFEKGDRVGSFSLEQVLETLQNSATDGTND